MHVLLVLLAFASPAFAKKPAPAETAPSGPVIEESSAADGVVVQQIDLDGNGKVEVRNHWRQRETGGRVLVKKESDLDLDGRFDMVSHFAEDGSLVREQMDSDLDGKLDWTDHYKDGQRVFAELDSNFDGRMDVFYYYLASEGGRPRLDRRERDTDADGKVDLWERFDTEGNVTRTARDTNGDGRMDEREE